MSARAVRVFLLNNYPADEALRLHAAGVYPGQHLWGFPPGGESGGRTWVLPGRSVYGVRWLARRPWSRGRDALVKLVGDPWQQAATLRRAGRGDVVYAADQRSAALLGLLRRLRLLRPRMVVVVHHPPRDPWQRLYLGRVDAVVTISPHVAARVDALLPAVPVRVLAPWGPDLASPLYAPPAAGGPDDAPRWDFVAAGKTNRDYRALREAARSGAVDGIVFDGATTTEYRRGRELRRAGSAGYPDVVAAVRAAATVVIPLRDPAVMAGLTEACDAIAVGRPVVVTRSPAFPYDVEGRGAGVVVPPGASAGQLVAAIRAARAGGDASVLARDYSTDAFAAAVDGVLDRVAPS